MPRSPGHVRFRGDTPVGSRLWFASAWLAGEIPARTPLTYREAKKSANVRDVIEKSFDSKIRIFDGSLGVLLPGSGSSFWVAAVLFSYREPRFRIVSELATIHQELRLKDKSAKRIITGQMGSRSNGAVTIRLWKPNSSLSPRLVMHR